MSWEFVAAHVALPSAVALAAGVGAWRCGRLLRYGRDPRLLKLMWFYGLFAASLVCMAIWTGQVAAGVAEELSGRNAANFTETLGDLHGAFAGVERVDFLLIAHHVLMLGSLGVGVRAFGRNRAPAGVVAAASLAILAPFIPVLLAIEVALTLYLAVQAILNSFHRRSPGSLQVAAGFSLFAAGHLLVFIFHSPGAARTPVGDLLALVGIALLVQLLPRPTA